MQVSEEALIAKVEKDYGSRFKNLWNPTIAKLAGQYGIDSHMYALWPLFKPELLQKAMQEYNDNPAAMDVRKYETPTTKTIWANRCRLHTRKCSRLYGLVVRQPMRG